MKKTFQISNFIAFIVVIIVNYLSNTGYFNGQTIADVSNQNKTLITPASYTFAIWGIIYLFLLAFVIYQARSLFISNAKDDFVLDVGWWFVLSCAANALWIITWLYGYTLTSIGIMLVLLVSLLQIIIKNRMELYDAPLSTIAFIWWPFVLYSGWITVATIVNISAYLVKIQWDGLGLDPVYWTIIMIIIAGVINILVIVRRNMREFAAVGVWSFIGIAVANWNSNTSIRYTAVTAALVLLVLISIHAYKNYDTNPLNKISRGEIN